MLDFKYWIQIKSCKISHWCFCFRYTELSKILKVISPSFKKITWLLEKFSMAHMAHTFLLDSAVLENQINIQVSHYPHRCSLFLHSSAPHSLFKWVTSTATIWYLTFSLEGFSKHPSRGGIVRNLETCNYLIGIAFKGCGTVLFGVAGVQHPAYWYCLLVCNWPNWSRHLHPRLGSNPPGRTTSLA